MWASHGKCGDAPVKTDLIQDLDGERAGDGAESHDLLISWRPAGACVRACVRVLAGEGVW